MKAHAVKPGTGKTFCGKPANVGHTYTEKLGRVNCGQCCRLLAKGGK